MRSSRTSGDLRLRPGRIISGIVLFSSVLTGMTGCTWLLGLEDGKAEADRLAEVVAELPGVESVEASGTEQNPTYAASARLRILMSTEATAAELENLYLEWEAAVSEREEERIRWVLDVSYRTDDCVSEVTFGADVQQLKDSAQFLPALCAAVEGGHVSIEDRWSGRTVHVIDPDIPVDVAQIRALPGAASEHDYWIIEGTEYRWPTED